MLSFNLATDLGQSHNRRNQDDESADSIGRLTEHGISELKSTQNHPKHPNHPRRKPRQTLTRAPLFDDDQEQGSAAWGSKSSKSQECQPLQEIDLADLATPSSSQPGCHSSQSIDDHHSHSNDGQHSHPDSDVHTQHNHSHDHDHGDGHDHAHHHSAPDVDHLHTQPRKLQSLLPKAATEAFSSISRSISSAFEPAEDLCAPETPVFKMFVTCIQTMAAKQGDTDSHHDHSHGDHGHSHGDHHHPSHSDVHTQQYQSPPPLPSSMADWKGQCLSPCLNTDGSVCTEVYQGSATRGHSHM